MRLLKYLFSKIKSNFFKIDILVIGNGYDLKKNYKTKFSHFMNQLLYDYIVNILNYKNEKNKKITQIIEPIVRKLSVKTEFKNFIEKEIYNNYFIRYLMHYYFPYLNIIEIYLKNSEDIVWASSFENVDQIEQIFEQTFSNCREEELEREEADYLRKIRLFKFWELTSEKLENYNVTKYDNVDTLWLDVENLIKDIVTDKIVSNYKSIFIYSSQLDSFCKLLKELQNRYNFLDYEIRSVDITQYIEGLELFKNLFCKYLTCEIESIDSQIDPIERKFDKILSLNYTCTFLNNLAIPEKKIIVSYTDPLIKV